MKTPEFVDTDLVSSERSPTNPTLASLRNGNPLAPSQGRAEIDAQVEAARQQMLELRRKQEELDRLRQELEELRRREDEFENGKAEMLDELSRSITAIEQEEFELNKRSTLLTNYREVYQDYIRQLDAIHESEWNKAELKSELARAFSVVEAARAELNKGRAQISSLGDGPLRAQSDSNFSQASMQAPAPAEFDFMLEFKRGFARHLPLISAGFLALLIWLIRGH